MHETQWSDRNTIWGWIYEHDAAIPVASCTPGSAQGDRDAGSCTTFRTKSFDHEEECTLTRRWHADSGEVQVVCFKFTSCSSGWVAALRPPAGASVRSGPVDRVTVRFVNSRVRGCCKTRNIGPTTYRRIIVRNVANLLQSSQMSYELCWIIVR